MVESKKESLDSLLEGLTAPHDVEDTPNEDDKKEKGLGGLSQQCGVLYL